MTADEAGQTAAEESGSQEVRGSNPLTSTEVSQVIGP